MTRPDADPADAGYRVQEWHQLGDIVPVSVGQGDGERCAMAVGDQTSDAVKESSRSREGRFGSGGERSGFVVVDAFGEAVVKVADHAVEEVA